MSYRGATDPGSGLVPGGTGHVGEPPDVGNEWVPPVGETPGTTELPEITRSTEACLANGSYVPIVYGRCFVGPDFIWGYSQYLGGYGQLRCALAFSMGEIDAFEQWAKDEKTLIAAGDKLTKYFEALDERTGSLSQLGASSGYLGAQFAASYGRFPGLAYAYMEMYGNIDFIPKCIIRGIKMYDPRIHPAWTSGAEPPARAYSANPALEMADLLTNTRYGAGISCTSVDWTSVTDAASYCDQIVDGAKRFECHLVIRDRDSLDSWFKLIGLHFGGVWQQREGLWTLVVRKETVDLQATITEDDIIGNPKVGRGVGAGLADQPNRVTVTWIDPASEWTERTVSVQTAEVDAGKPVRESSSTYRLHGCQNERQAYRSAWYLLNSMTADMTLNVELMPSMTHLRVGHLITAYLPSVGLSGQQFIVTQTGRDGDPPSIQATEYNPAIFQPAAYTPSALPAPTPADPYDPDNPPEITSVTSVTGANGGWGIHWGRPTWVTRDRFASGWTVNGSVSGANTAYINDGSLDSIAFSFQNATTREVILDCGSGVTRAFTGVVLTIGARPSGSVTVIPYYSDNGTSWTAVPASVTQGNSATAARWVFEYRWASAGAHRYWKFVEQAFFEPVTRDYYEVQFLVGGAEYPNVKHYEIRAVTATESKIVAVIPPASAPTSTNPFDTEPYWYFTGEVDQSVVPGFAGKVLQYLDMSIVVVAVNGKRSEGRGAFWRRNPITALGGASSSMRAYAQIPGQDAAPTTRSSPGKMVSAVVGGRHQISENGGPYANVLTDAGATPGVTLQASTPGTPQTGNANVSGRILAGSIGRSGGSAAWTLPAAEGASGQFLKTDGAGNLVFGDVQSELFLGTISLGPTLTQATEFLSVTTPAGAGFFTIETVVDRVSNSHARSFGYSAQYYAGTGAWFGAIPIGSRPLQLNDWEVDERQSYQTITFRVRRVASDGATTLAIRVRVTGCVMPPYTLATAPTVTYGNSIAGVASSGFAVKPGAIMLHTEATAPAGWLLCDGSAYDTTAYSRLFSVIGYTFGGAGSSFYVPDMRQRFALGKAVSGKGATLGETGGSIDHTHTTVSQTGAGLVYVPTTGATQQINHSHVTDAQNPPYLALPYIIRF